MKNFTRRTKIKHLARPSVQESLHTLDLSPRDFREVRAFREELTNDAVGVLVGPALPRTMWMSKKYLDLSVARKELVLGHFFTPVVRQRARHLPGQRSHLPREGTADARSVLSFKRHKDRGAGGALYQSSQSRGVASSHHKISLPM